jgi:hypothetical protein
LLASRRHTAYRWILGLLRSYVEVDLQWSKFLNSLSSAAITGPEGGVEVGHVRRPQSHCPNFDIDYRFSVFHDRLKTEGTEVR